MNKLKRIMAAGAVWLGILGSAHAYIVDWTKPYEEAEIGLSFVSSNYSIQMDQNPDLTDRMVSTWQSFNAPQEATLGGITLNLSVTEPGSVDLNVYEGEGVEGRLLSTTKLEWDTLYEGWCSLKLNKAGLQAGGTYTFALENLTQDGIMSLRASRDILGSKMYTMVSQITGRKAYRPGIDWIRYTFVLRK